VIDFDDVITIDFETDPIEGRPKFPPTPVGVSIKYGRAPSRYYAWGHHSGGNNCSLKEADEALSTAYYSGRPVLCHNLKFDLCVAQEGLGYCELPWNQVHDTTFLVFLADPHCRHAGLKEICDDWLSWPPEERDAIGEWLWDHRARLYKETGRRVTRHKGKVSNIGTWLSWTPGDVVAPYAEGDTDRTFALFEHLYPIITDNGMLEAYDRERQLLPILMENERVGMRVDLEALGRDMEACQRAKEIADDWLRKRLRQPELNIDSDDEFAEALAEAEVVDDDKWTFTKTGKRSVSKQNLVPLMYNDPEVASAFGYRNRMATSLKMFMEPWYAQGEASDGRISTNWNQIRGGEGGGTRTGRPSTSSPNFLNISKDFETKKDGYAHPDHLDVPTLPLVRKYVLPDEDHLFLHRDFDGQELRVFAHFEQGDLFRKYLEDPRLDVHSYVGDKMTEMTVREFERTWVKVINFQSIYGGGLQALMRGLDISRDEAKEFKAFHDQALPGRKTLNEEIKRIALSGEAIRTWGGRMYYPEEPKIINGRKMDFIYKLLNYLVQGSAADATKEGIIRWHNHPDRDPSDRFLVTVYDEINISAHKERWQKAMAVLKECMEGLEFDVPMLSSPKVGESWGACKKVEE